MNIKVHMPTMICRFFLNKASQSLFPDRTLSISQIKIADIKTRDFKFRLNRKIPKIRGFRIGIRKSRMQKLKNHSDRYKDFLPSGCLRFFNSQDGIFLVRWNILKQL